MLGSAALPLSALELRDAVRSARRFDPARLDRVLRLDPDRGQIEVQAGTSWKALGERAGLPEGFAAEWGRTGASIGEAAATNAAGPDGRPLVGQIESLALVTPDGELRRCSRESHAELFALAIGGQGIFGACYSITLDLKSLLRSFRERHPVAELELDPEEAAAEPLRLLVPPDALEGFLAAARSRCAEWRVRIRSIQVRRTLPETETILRWARREFAEVMLLLGRLQTIGGSVRATQLRRALIDAALSQGGSFAIACTPEATREHVTACYPELIKVMAEKRRIDPTEKLANGWYRHHRSLLTREAVRVRWSDVIETAQNQAAAA